MSHTCQNSRRTFLQSSALAGAVWLSGRARAARATENLSLKIMEPMSGAVFHARIGRPVPNGLEIDVTGSASADAQVLVQDRLTSREGPRFRGTAILRDRENEIVVKARLGSEQRQAVTRVLWDQDSRPRYRFVIDDNSFFLRDITQRGYKSLFDCFYLKMLRDLHEKYRTCFTLNIYYTTGADWNLRQFPDTYRAQWQDNAHWLRLAFHAYANEPACPYEDAPVPKLLADLDLVNNEILRFAGPETHSPPVVIHWGMTRPEAWKALYDHDSRVLGGYFRQDSSGQWVVNYRLDNTRSAWLSRHDLLKDFPSGIIFSKVDMVVNNTPLAQIVPTLKQVIADPNQAEIVDLLTHEQYFWPFYQNYLPDHPQRMDAAIRFLAEQGYEPVFLQNGFLGGPGRADRGS